MPSNHQSMEKKYEDNRPIDKPKEQEAPEVHPTKEELEEIELENEKKRAEADLAVSERQLENAI